MKLWGCGYNHCLIDDCAGADTDEYQDYQDPCDDPGFIDETVYLMFPFCDRLAEQFIFYVAIRFYYMHLLDILCFIFMVFNVTTIT